MVDPEIIKEIQKLSKQGESLSSIAKQFGISWLTVKKYAAGEGNSERDKPKLSHNRGAISPRVVPVSNPSESLRAEREITEIVGLKVEQAKNMKELEKVTGPKEHPVLVEKRARVEVAKLDLDEYQARKQLEKLRKEELEKVMAEEEVRIQEEVERQVLQEERERKEKYQKWVKSWQDWALDSGVPRGVSIPADIKFRIKDTVVKALMDRSEHEDRWDIEELVKITTQSVLQPFLDKIRAEKKIRLIESWAFPQVEDYIREQGLEAYVNEESKGKIKEYVRNHFTKVLVGNESIIFSYQVRELLDNFFKPIKEEIKEAKEEERREQERLAREKKEAEDKAFWEGVKEKREKEAEETKKERIEELMRAGTNRLYTYLAINRKELKTVSLEEQQRAKRYLEKELKEEIEGTETSQEVEKIADEILDDFFFEE